MQPGWPTRPPAPNDGKAVASVVLGILSLLGATCWLGLPLGIPAIVLGALAHRDIRRSEGAVGGGGMATAGIVMGSVGSLLFAGSVVAMMVMFTGTGLFGPLGPTRHTPPPAFVPPSSAEPEPSAAEAEKTQGGDWGSIHRVALHPSPTETLLAQLREQSRSARAAGETVLVETTAPACGACAEIASAMPEPALQQALSGVRVVSVDVAELGAQAASLRLATPGLPWFYLLDAQGAPRDGISADEWDDNEADNVAPVLRAFVRGKLPARRVPWRGSRAL